MKINRAIALKTLGLPTWEELIENGTPFSLKTAYRRAALRSHPDRSDNADATASMQMINDAYRFLSASDFDEKLKIAAESFGRRYEKNEGHELCGAGVPALKPRDVLLRELFSVRDTVDQMPSVTPWYDGLKNKLSFHAYFQYCERDYVIRWYNGYGYSQVFYVTDITNAGRAGKECFCLSFEVSGGDDLISSALRAFIRQSPFPSGEPEDGFNWGLVFSQLQPYLTADEPAAFELYGLQFVPEAANRSDFRWKVALDDINGNFVVRYCADKSAAYFNPFKLDVYKPLTKLPEKFKMLDLIKVLVNGQYAEFKRDYYYTDDYRMDAALDFRKGYIENPFKAIKEWIEHRGRKGCADVWLRNGIASFGFHSNDSSSLKVVLSNSYPLESLDDELLLLTQAADAQKLIA